MSRNSSNCSRSMEKSQHTHTMISWDIHERSSEYLEGFGAKPLLNPQSCTKLLWGETKTNENQLLQPRKPWRLVCVTYVTTDPLHETSWEAEVGSWQIRSFSCNCRCATFSSHVHYTVFRRWMKERRKKKEKYKAPFFPSALSRENIK